VKLAARTPSILIIDDDLGFVFWLGQLFNEIGYRTIPALNPKDALALAGDLNRGVDLLVANPGLRGTAGLIRILSRVKRPKIILIVDAAATVNPRLRGDAILDRPSGWGPVSQPEWRQKISRILTDIGIRAAS